MESVIQLLEYNFFTNALIASVFTALSCGIIGTYVVSRRIVFVSGGITHASFGGIGIAYYMGLNPIAGAAVFSLLSGLGIEALTRKADVRNDSVIAMLWSFGMAIGIIFIYLTPGYSPNLMTYLFGSILTINRNDLLLLGLLSGIIILFFILFFRKILYITFDEVFARTRGISVNFISYSLMALVAFTIVLNIKTVGIILLISLLTVPQNTANLFTKDFKSIIYLSVILAFTGSVAGLVISYYLNIPSGATIIFSLIVIYLTGRIFRAFPQRQLGRRKK